MKFRLSVPRRAAEFFAGRGDRRVLAAIAIVGLTRAAPSIGSASGRSDASEQRTTCRHRRTIRRGDPRSPSQPGLDRLPGAARGRTRRGDAALTPLAAWRARGRACSTPPARCSPASRRRRRARLAWHLACRRPRQALSAPAQRVGLIPAHDRWHADTAALPRVGSGSAGPWLMPSAPRTPAGLVPLDRSAFLPGRSSFAPMARRFLPPRAKPGRGRVRAEAIS